MSEITQERMEQAMTYLAQTDHEYAEQKAELERSEIFRKRTRATVFLTVDGTVAERQAKAEIHNNVTDSDDRYIQCVKLFETLKARRERAEIVIDVWRSLNAARRKV
jgi:alpha-galactosidase